jgi:hypothetical protein
MSWNTEVTRTYRQLLNDCIYTTDLLTLPREHGRFTLQPKQLRWKHDTTSAWQAKHLREDWTHVKRAEALSVRVKDRVVELRELLRDGGRIGHGVYRRFARAKWGWGAGRWATSCSVHLTWPCSTNLIDAKSSKFVDHVSTVHVLFSRRLRRGALGLV